MKEIPLKINDTTKSNSNNQPGFYIRNLYENERHKKIIHFNFMKKIPVKMKTQKIKNCEYFVKCPLKVG